MQPLASNGDFRNWPKTEVPQRVRLVLYREKLTSLGHRRTTESGWTVAVK
jgi:hypothetical protein